MLYQQESKIACASVQTPFLSSPLLPSSSSFPPLLLPPKPPKEVYLTIISTHKPNPKGSNSHKETYPSSRASHNLSQEQNTSDSPFRHTEQREGKAEEG